MRVVMLLTGQRLGEIGTQQPTEAAIDSVEALRQILTKQQQREIGYEEAREIGDSLIEFYEVLAEEVQDAPAS
jgi:hypothetical protein